MTFQKAEEEVAEATARFHADLDAAPDDDDDSAVLLPSAVAAGRRHRRLSQIRAVPFPYSTNTHLGHLLVS